MTRRGYSREFTPHGDTGKRYLLDEIPAGMWSAVRDKCKRDGVSVRAVILGLLHGWVTDQLTLRRDAPARHRDPAADGERAARRDAAAMRRSAVRS